MKPSPSPDAIATGVAEGQWGLIRHDQAREAGLSEGQIKRRCTSGRWRRAAPHVYAIAGAPASWQRAALAACFAGPPGCVASFFTAAALHRVWDPPLLPHITAPRGTSGRLRIATVHRADIDPRDQVRVDGIPCTSPARTLVDAAQVLAREPLAELVDTTLCKRLASSDYTLAVAARAQRGPGRRGLPLLREVLEAWSVKIQPGSPAEMRALRLLEEWGFGRAVRQHKVCRADGTVIGRLDLAFPDFRDGAEYDSVRWHNPRRWAHDEARYAEFKAAGWHVASIDKHDLIPGEHQWRDAFAATRAHRRAAFRRNRHAVGR